ncbi:unnamed protein product [Cyclocybe aegerita]|uniref:N-acetyltransferase domain-containing protein n=1 Tax=Cyclocybe aegerita TaxID=1973307 RepID=A0A8S0VZS9_CYCAE|nr:unnamed protein product [Cyclocybe aegerita]
MIVHSFSAVLSNTRPSSRYSHICRTHIVCLALVLSLASYIYSPLDRLHLGQASFSTAPQYPGFVCIFTLNSIIIPLILEMLHYFPFFSFSDFRFYRSQHRGTRGGRKGSRLTAYSVLEGSRPSGREVRASRHHRNKNMSTTTRTSPAPLPSTIWVASRPSTTGADSTSTPIHISIYHLTLTTARALPGLIEYLRDVFARVVEDGMTYPQEEPLTQGAFEAYFFAADAFIGIIGKSPRADVVDGEHQATDIDAERDGRTWEEAVAGCYYVKPNYPGRSSHICNAGFIVPPKQRGSGCGSALSRSYVHYAPRLGYHGSVFNLVYVNNTASVRLWEKLGFTKAGRIPQAGRLKKKDGTGEEYVDAWVFYKNFIQE